MPNATAITHAFLPQFRAMLAVAGLSIRAAVRSRVVATLLVLLAAGVIGLPYLITGDGTPASEIQVRLRYTLIFGVGVLGLATLWASCAAFGAEIDSRRMDLTAVKPVYPLTLWLGRWFGILLLDSLLLLGVVLGVRVQLNQRLTRADAAALLVSRVIARPLLPAPETEAKLELEELRRSNALPQDIAPAALFLQLVQKSRNRYAAFHPGEHASWNFHLTQPVAADGKLWIRLRFDTDAMSLADVRGTCKIRRPGETIWAVEIPVNDLVRQELEFPVSATQLANATELELEFTYAVGKETAVLMIQPRRAIEVLTPHGTFTGNLVRVLLAQLAILAALAALGLTLGACFTFPVAAFVATALLLTVLIASGNVPDTLQEAFSTEAHPGWMEHVSFAVTRSVDHLTRPLLEPEPLAQAAAGERVPGSELGRVLFWGGLAYPLVLAGLAACVLRQRELAKLGPGG